MTQWFPISRALSKPPPQPARSVSLQHLIYLLVALMLAGCSNGHGLPGFAPGQKVLRLASADDLPTLDPASGYDNASWTFEQEIFDTLVRYGDADVELHPSVATSWTISPDATVFSFRLRRDARFSNGRAVTGADFKYAIERVLLPATRSKGMEYYRGIVGAIAFAAGKAEHVQGIEASDPYTLVFRLQAPDPLFVHKLGMPFAAAVPREVVERWGEDFSSHALGSGPFELREWLPGQRIVLVRNPFYYAKDRVRLDGIYAQLAVNEELQWLKYRAGEIDVIGDPTGRIPPAVFPLIMRTPKLKALTLKNITVTTDYMGMNCQMAPFDDVRVRTAFNYGINKEKILALLNHRGIVADGVLPPSLPGYKPRPLAYPYAPATARRLLEEAHFPSNLRPLLWMRADQTLLRLGESIQQDLALLGIQVILKPVAWGPLLDAIRQPKAVELFLLAWEADFPDPENFLDVLLSEQQWSSNNDSFFYNPQFERLLDQARPLTDLQQRYQIYDQAEKIAIDQAPWVFLYHPVNYVIRQPWVHDYTLNPMRPTRFESVSLSAH